MSPPGCGGLDGPTNTRVWTNATVDIFGEALSPPSVGGSANTASGQAAASDAAGGSRRSLEERIKALDAKFSALDQMIKGAKERPQQPIRQIAATSMSSNTAAAAAAAGNIDYSKYKVVKKPSVCGIPSSPSALTPAILTAETILNKPTILNSHQRTSAFDYDSQRILGNLSMNHSATPFQDESNNWNQPAGIRPVSTPVK